MASNFRIVTLCIFIWAAFQTLPQAQHWEDDFNDLFDKRPPVKALFIGNSRTAQFDMPFMVRKIADSAHSKYKYEITMDAPPGIRLEDHWNSSDTQNLLHQKWDYVVLQERSNEQETPEWEASFQYYGKELTRVARSNSAAVMLFVGWRYSDNDPLYQRAPQFKNTLHGLVQESYFNLARDSGAQLVNIGSVWEKIRTANPEVPLFQDTNHESATGAYLCALMFYRAFSHDDLKNVTYIPEGVTPKDAELLKTAAQSW